MFYYSAYKSIKIPKYDEKEINSPLHVNRLIPFRMILFEIARHNYDLCECRSVQWAI